MADAACGRFIRVGVKADTAVRDDLVVVFDCEEAFALFVEEEFAGDPAVGEPSHETMTLRFGLGYELREGWIVWGEWFWCHR